MTTHQLEDMRATMTAHWDTDLASEVRAVVSRVSALSGVSERRILSKSRAQECVIPRQVAFWSCRKLGIPCQDCNN